MGREGKEINILLLLPLGSHTKQQVNLRRLSVSVDRKGGRGSEQCVHFCCISALHTRRDRQEEIVEKDCVIPPTTMAVVELETEGVIFRMELKNKKM